MVELSELKTVCLSAAGWLLGALSSWRRGRPLLLVLFLFDQEDERTTSLHRCAHAFATSVSKLITQLSISSRGRGSQYGPTKRRRECATFYCEFDSLIVDLKFAIVTRGVGWAGGFSSQRVASISSIFRNISHFHLHSPFLLVKDEWTRCIGSSYQKDSLYRFGRFGKWGNDWVPSA